MDTARGYALIIVLFAMMLFSLLGVTVFSVTLADMRISRHIAQADQAYYYAEAGIERAAAELPRAVACYLAYEAEFERLEGQADGPPYFTVTVAPYSGAEEDRLRKRIRATGMAEGKQRTVEVWAGLQLFGGNVLVSPGLIALDQVTAGGNVLAGEVLFQFGQSEIRGNLVHDLDVATVGGGGYRVLGQECSVPFPGESNVDFDLLEALARSGCGEWFIPEQGEDGSCDWRDFPCTDSCGGVFVPGDLTIAGDFLFSGLMVARGTVYLQTAEVYGPLAILAEGDILLGMGGDVPVHGMYGGCLLYSAGEILDTRADKLPCIVHGVLIGRGGISLTNVELIYEEEPLLPYVEALPEGALPHYPSLLLEWVDTAPRR
jgi:hypothetical protein